MNNYSPYYSGDSIPLRFTLTDSTGAVNPSASKITILKPDNTVTTETNATVAGNVVTYTVPASVTDKKGKYKAYFVNTLSYGERTHKIEFDVTPNVEENL